MKHFTFLLLACLLSLPAFSQKSNKEKALDALIEAGMMRREGNNLIFRVNSYSDTAQYKLMYSGLINDPKVRLRFETISGVNTPKQSFSPDNTGLNTSGQANVNPADLTQMTASSGSGSAFSNMKTFGFVGVVTPGASQQFSEHQWTVPPGVTRLRLEGWSAGADGAGVDFIAGGGGGGGAYFMALIEVEAGDNLRIRVPGSGKNVYPLVVQFTNGNKGSLTLRSGFYPIKEASNLATYDGKGGFLEQNSGLFANSTFSIRGEDGEKNFLVPTERIMENVYKFYQDGKKGGDAPRGGFGGKGAKHISLFEGGDETASDGSFPGGGGGGGLEMTNIRGLESGKGAAGFLIIYY